MRTVAELIAETQQVILREAETFRRGEELLTRAKAVGQTIEQRVEKVLDHRRRGAFPGEPADNRSLAFG
jgi:exonuclease VII small subunit